MPTPTKQQKRLLEIAKAIKNGASYDEFFNELNEMLGSTSEDRDSELDEAWERNNRDKK